MKKVLCAFDGSEQAVHAYDYALELAKRFDASVLVLAVARLPEPPTEVETEAMLESASQYFQGEFMRLRERAGIAALQTQIDYDVAVGHPAEQIIHRARVEGADLIVMGRRGRSAVQEWLLGSVSKRVLSYAHCAVLIVR